MRTYRILALPGDGIGPEVMRAARRVIEGAVAQTEGLRVEIADGSGQRSNAADDRVSGDTLYTAAEMRRQADDRGNAIHLAMFTK